MNAKKLLPLRISFKKSSSLLGEGIGHRKSCWNTTRHHISSKQTLFPAAIVNFFSLSQRIPLIHYFPLDVNSGRSTTKQEFSGEALSKQNIKASLALLPFDSSRTLTEWSAIFAFGVLRE